jgi:23S rRNA (adenine2503-C2)-methyltransferase
MKIGIKNLLEEDLFKYFEKIGEKKFRVKQLFDAIYSKRVRYFNEITNFSKVLQEQLEKDFYINSLFQFSYYKNTKKHRYIKNNWFL